MKKVLVKSLFKKGITKKQHILILFLFCSTLFWFLIKLSKVYEAKLVYNVNYTHLPSSKLFQDTPSNQLELMVKGTGFKLLKEELRTSKLDINLRGVVANGKYEYYLLSKRNELKVQKQLGESVDLIGFVADTLFFQLGFNKRKRVPVISNLDLRFKSGYNLSNKVFIVPDSIEISGPEIQVDEVNSISSVSLKLDNILENIDNEISIVKPLGLDKLKFSSETVTILGQVEKFTEDSFEVPFVIDGLPPSTNITTYPNRVKVFYQVGLSNYKKIAANDFKIVCSYLESEVEGTNYLIPRLMEKPTLVSSIRLVPDRIEYLIQK